jgi:hypothetical protein
MSMYVLAQKNKDVSSETQCRMDIGIVAGGTLLRQIIN